ncbi:MAG TPA: hypothetical protein VFG29_12150 [Syntrophales bacterium]|nr:hypothetical protein [Syntrophales bacterium]
MRRGKSLVVDTVVIMVDTVVIMVGTVVIMVDTVVMVAIMVAITDITTDITGTGTVGGGIRGRIHLRSYHCITRLFGGEDIHITMPMGFIMLQSRAVIWLLIHRKVQSPSNHRLRHQ